MVDDHQLILDGLVKILSDLDQVEELATANNGVEALERLQLEMFDLVVSDIEMPRMNGIELLRKNKSDHPQQKVLMLTMYNNAGLAREIIKLEADGYVLKSANEQELRYAVSTILSGRKHFSQDITLELAGGSTMQSGPTGGLNQLTDREREILILVAQGFSNKEIAAKLFISAKTVDTHRTKLMQKLDIHNAAGLTRFAVSHKLI